MNCAKAQRLLHLDRPGERTTSEESWLQDHLRSCSACTGEAERIGGLAALESRLRASEVDVPDLRRVRANVLEATAGSSGRYQRLKRLLLRIQARPAVRLAYGLAVLGFTVWFAAGQTEVRMARTSLDSRGVTSATRVGGPEVVYTVDPQAVSRARQVAAAVPPTVFPTSGVFEIAQPELDEVLRVTEHQLLRNVLQGAVSRARLTEIIRTIQPAIVVTIRFRPQGA